MNKTSKILMSSLAAIVLCIALVSGATFALFTSEAHTDITVSSGKVAIESTVTDLVGYYAQWNADTGSYDNVTVAEGSSFINGGTFVFDGSATPALNLSLITPGDGVRFNISVTNNSTVATKYRFKLRCDDGLGLISAMRVTIGENVYNGIIGYTSAWTELPIGGDALKLPVELYLPIDIDNDVQGQECKVLLTVEAVQGNANATEEESVEYYNPDASYVGEIDELQAAIADGEKEIAFTSDMVYENSSYSEKPIKLQDEQHLDMRGHTFNIHSSRGYDGFTFDQVGGAATIENAIISIDHSAGTNYGAVNVDHGELTLKNVTLSTAESTSSTSKPLAARVSGNSGNKLTLIDCDIRNLITVGSGAVLETFNSSIDKLLTTTNCICNLTGGTFKGTNDKIGERLAGTLTMTDCKLVGDLVFAEGKATMTGGEVHGNIVLSDSSYSPEFVANGTTFYVAKFARRCRIVTLTSCVIMGDCDMSELVVRNTDITFATITDTEIKGALINGESSRVVLEGTTSYGSLVGSVLQDNR